MKLKQEFEKSKSEFDNLLKQVESKKDKIVFSKGEYYEETPFSYQRLGFKKGKLYKDENKVKFNKNLQIYYFDKNENLLLTKQATSIQEQYYFTFFIWENNYLVKSLRFNNQKSILNIIEYHYNGEELKETNFYGTRGLRNETYYYLNGKLIKIKGQSSSKEVQSQQEYNDIFEYNDSNNLLKITREFDNGYSEQFYPR